MVALKDKRTKLSSHEQNRFIIREYPSALNLIRCESSQQKCDFETNEYGEVLLREPEINTLATAAKEILILVVCKKKNFICKCQQILSGYNYLRISPDQAESLEQVIEEFQPSIILFTTSKAWVPNFGASGRYNISLRNLFDVVVVAQIPLSINTEVFQHYIGQLISIHAKETHIRLFSGAFNKTSDGVIVTNAKSKILSVNKGFTQVTGYTADEVIGKTPAILQSGKQKESFYRELWADIKNHDHWEGEIWNRRKSGEIYPQRMSISAVKTTDGTVHHYVAVFSDLTSIKIEEKKMVHLAYHDPLTGLPNRLLLYERLVQSLHNAERHQYNVALLFVDLDHFKPINDQYGHHIGDEVLREIADRLRTCVRKTDIIARVGGDEFVAVITDVQQQQDVEQVAHKINELLAQPVVIDNVSYQVSASIGISLYPSNGNSMSSLVKTADHAMYAVKAEGGNGFKFATVAVVEDVFEYSA